MSASNYSNIPQEFLPGRWGVASLAPIDYTDADGNAASYPDKRPRHPADGSLLSVSLPDGGVDDRGNSYRPWATFHECANCGAPAIGKLLRVDDGFVVLDLDDMRKSPRLPEHMRETYWQYQQKILDEAFPHTYTERSVSGLGLHAIYKATLPGGKRADAASDLVGAELYGHARFMLTTGNVYRNLPIAEAQPQTDRMVAAITAAGGVDAFTEDQLTGAGLTAQQLKDKLSKAANKDKFKALFTEGYTSRYAQADRSETDASFAQLMAYYQPGFRAFVELWQQSALWRVRDDGSVDKPGYHSERVYLSNYIARTYEFTVGRAVANAQAERLRTEDDRKRNAALAAGMLAGMAERKAREAAAEGAEAAAAGAGPAAGGQGALGAATPAAGATPATGGQQGQPGGMGRTPVSKAKGYDMLLPPPGLMGEVADYVYSSAARPNRDIAAATAITFFSALVGRFCRTYSGSTLTQYTVILAKSGYGKNEAVKAISRIVDAAKAANAGSMLQFFIGPGNIMSGQGLRKHISKHPSIFCNLTEFSADWSRITSPMATSADRDFKRVLLEAWDTSKLGSMAYSDSDKNVEAVAYPNFCFVGDATVDDFMENMELGSVGDGLAPRMTIVECKQDRQAVNPRVGHAPSAGLIERLDQWAMQVVQSRNEGDKAHKIPRDAEATAILEELSEWEDRVYNADEDGMAPIWARVTHKATRYATLAAVARNLPAVDADCARWGVAMARTSAKWLVSQFRKGAAGSGGDTAPESLLTALARGMDAKARASDAAYFVGLADNEVPRSFIAKHLRRIKYFRKQTSTDNAITTSLFAAQAEGWIEQVSLDEMKERGFLGKQAVYRVLRDPRR